LQILATPKNSSLLSSGDSALFAQNTGLDMALLTSISPDQPFQLQSPVPVWHAANPHAPWAQDQNGSSEVRE